MARASNRLSPESQSPPVQDRPANAPRRSLRSRPEGPTERAYEVTGPKVVGGKRKGETVTLTLTDAQEAALIDAGHVTPIEARPVVATEKEG